jgi:hypothetical protein
MPDAEPGGELCAVAVMPVEQLEDAGRIAGCADPLLDAVCCNRIDQPDPAVRDESVRATLHELVDDPAEAAAEPVAKPEAQRCHIAAQCSK